MFGWRAFKTAEPNTRQAERVRLAGAAMHLIGLDRLGSGNVPPSGLSEPMGRSGENRNEIRTDFRDWCPGKDSNLHLLQDWYLKPARLPIPPPGLAAGHRPAPP